MSSSLLESRVLSILDVLTSWSLLMLFVAIASVAVVLLFQTIDVALFFFFPGSMAFVLHLSPFSSFGRHRTSLVQLGGTCLLEDVLQHLLAGPSVGFSYSDCGLGTA
ncbi:hypothetical protein K1719_004045 [Acacia pycnantha]|nr:hypothetical protein K1719_004045 [Acacia pycnantha]